MKKYEAYKDSGIEWIGMIPEGWECLRMKYFAELVTTPSTSDNKIGLENIESSTGRFIPTDSEFEGNGISFMPDDIVYGKLRPYLQKVWKADMEGNAVGDFFVLRCNSKSCPTYLKYLLLSPNFTSVANGSTYGAKMPRVSSEFMMNFSWFLPSYSEQQAIADYLDYKVGQIDTSVAGINTQIEDLKAYRQSVISEAVTKGLNPDAPMKDSGIEWIGMIPEGWECLPMKRGLTINNGKDYKDVQSEEGYPVIGSGGQFAYATDFLYDGEAVLLGRKGTIDKPMYYNGKFWTVDTMFYAVPDDDVCCKYMYYQAQTIPFGLYSTNTALPSMTQTALADNPMCFPPLAEQKAIADYLDEKTSKIDTAIKSLENQRDDLNALRQTVISEAVTGKIDLRDWKKNK